jgi:hypothetical protein
MQGEALADEMTLASEMDQSKMPEDEQMRQDFLLQQLKIATAISTGMHTVGQQRNTLDCLPTPTEAGTISDSQTQVHHVKRRNTLHTFAGSQTHQAVHTADQKDSELAREPGSIFFKTADNLDGRDMQRVNLVLEAVRAKVQLADNSRSRKRGRRMVLLPNGPVICDDR